MLAYVPPNNKKLPVRLPFSSGTLLPGGGKGTVGVTGAEGAETFFQYIYAASTEDLVNTLYKRPPPPGTLQPSSACFGPKKGLTHFGATCFLFPSKSQRLANSLV